MGALLVNSVHLASERIFDQNLELFGLFTDEVNSLIEVFRQGSSAVAQGLWREVWSDPRSISKFTVANFSTGRRHFLGMQGRRPLSVLGHGPFE
jgi:hypothetical protein